MSSLMFPPLITDSERSVVPNSLLRARFQLPCTAGMPPVEAHKKGLPLYSLHGDQRQSIFDVVTTELWIDPETDEPRLKFSQPIYGVDPFTLENWGIHTDSKGREKSQKIPNRISVNLFSATDKMSCPSWSLPSGPPNEGGTCWSARMEQRNLWNDRGRDPNLYVCSGCYAVAANYIYWTTVTSQAARLHWMRKLFESGQSDVFVDAMTLAIKTVARKTVKLSSTTKRKVLELGVWKTRTICVPFRGRGMRKTALKPIPAPTLQNHFDWFKFRVEAGKLKDYDIVRSENEQNPNLSYEKAHADIAGFFRIHDAGDLAITSKEQSWIEVLLAWEQIAKRFPNVIFWIPTRMWPFKNTKEAMVAITSRTDNLIIRPSNLHCDAPAPVIPGLPAGTTVEQRLKGIFVEQDDAGRPTRHCPAYPFGISDSQSCLEHFCRWCWDDPWTPVAYSKH
jgi:hypothetical protein